MARPPRQRPELEDAEAPAAEAPPVAPPVALTPQVETLVSNGSAPTAPPAQPTARANHAPDAPATQNVPSAPAAPPQEQTVASTELSVHTSAEIEQALPPDDNHRSPFGGDGKLHFEAVTVGSDTPLIDLPREVQRRTAHLGFRVTEKYLKDFKKKLHLLAAIHEVPIDTVNIFVLQELSESFGRVDERIVKYLEQGRSQG